MTFSSHKHRTHNNRFLLFVHAYWLWSKTVNTIVANVETKTISKSQQQSPWLANSVCRQNRSAAFSVVTLTIRACAFYLLTDRVAARTPRTSAVHVVRQISRRSKNPNRTTGNVCEHDFRETSITVRAGRQSRCSPDRKGKRRAWPALIKKDSSFESRVTVTRTSSPRRSFIFN